MSRFPFFIFFFSTWRTFHPCWLNKPWFLIDVAWLTLCSEENHVIWLIPAKWPLHFVLRLFCQMLFPSSRINFKPQVLLSLFYMFIFLFAATLSSTVINGFIQFISAFKNLTAVFVCRNWPCYFGASLQHLWTIFIETTEEIVHRIFCGAHNNKNSNIHFQKECLYLR